VCVGADFDPAWAMQGLDIRTTPSSGQYGSPSAIGRYEDGSGQLQHSGGGTYGRTQSPMAAWFDSDVWADVLVLKQGGYSSVEVFEFCLPLCTV